MALKVLLTGAGGQLGADTARAFSGEYALAAFDSRGLDITDREKVFDTVKAEAPGVIINCAAYTKVDKAEEEPERAFAVNRDGARNIAEAAASVNAVLLHISTDFVFDGIKPAPYVEVDPTNPLGVYGESKLRGEWEIIKSFQRHIIIRVSWLYGTGGHNFVKTILKYAAERETLRVVYDQVGGPTWTADLAGALLRVVKAVEENRAPYGVYHYSNEGVASWYDFALSIVEEALVLGAPIKCSTVEPILTHEWPTPARRPPYSVLNKDKIKETFGLKVPHWRTSLKGMLKELYGGRDA